MKIAIATNDYTHVAGHAGQSRHWLLYDSSSDSVEPERIHGQPLHPRSTAP
jgi:hypothetical protein